MTHLTDLELVDAMEINQLALERRRHLDACAACRDRLDEVRESVADAQRADVPEPSPLFWDHFSARVREGIDADVVSREEAAPSSLGWLRNAGMAWAVSGALVTLLMVAMVWRVNAPTPAAPIVERGAHTPELLSDPLDRPDVDADPAWAVVRTMADGVASDDAIAVGLGAGPDAAEAAARALTPEERSELVKLLLAEAKRPGV